MYKNLVLPCVAFAWSCLAQHGVVDQAPLISYKHKPVLHDQLIEFHKNLTQIESITYNEAAAGKWLAESLETQGYTVEKQYVDREADRFNVYAYLGRSGEPTVLVSSHIDTVSMSALLM